MKKNISILFLVVGLFAIAMGFLETAVVVYLRDLYFPEGFTFPMAPINKDLAQTELFRELATVIMLATVGFLAGRNIISRFAWFLYSFAVWDIFYYVFLKILLDWPESLMTDDVLFLIPVVWIGPVIAPVVLACLMIVFAYFIIKADSEKDNVIISKIEWGMLTAGSLVLIIAFAWDYGRYVLQNFSFGKLWVWPSNGVLSDVLPGYVPEQFNWLLYSAGLVLIISGIMLFYRRNLYTSE